MNAAIQQTPRRLIAWLSVVWLCAFLSPTFYFLLLLLANKFQIRLSQAFALSLFFLVPVIALLSCEWAVWSCSKTVGRRIGWMLCTLLAMLIQCAIILAVLRAILVAAIGYAQ
ncbi:MAG TPA: hypothetical protein VFP96_17040 [Candidatus Acidoferrum sp.]|nr:hypothetical protein [Candidatus Acidoferrum sp.]